MFDEVFHRNQELLKEYKRELKIVLSGRGGIDSEGRFFDYDEATDLEGCHRCDLSEYFDRFSFNCQFTILTDKWGRIVGIEIPMSCGEDVRIDTRDSKIYCYRASDKIQSVPLDHEAAESIEDHFTRECVGIEISWMEE